MMTFGYSFPSGFGNPQERYFAALDCGYAGLLLCWIAKSSM